MSSSNEPTKPESLPALKHGLEAVEFEHEGKPMILIRDQEGLSDQSLALSFGGFLVASLMNGRNSLEEIRTAFNKASGALLSNAEIQTLIDSLEKADLLETPCLQEKRKKILDEFLASPVRKAVHIGNGYPKDPLELALLLGKYFRDAKGPQKEVSALPHETSLAVGLIAPHIDLARGGPAYAWAYQALSEHPEPDLIVALGVAHVSPPSPWIATKKSYETPYGPMAVDENLYQEFKKTLWYDPSVDEWSHRTEHSLEFQALWLKYLWKDKTPAWLPVLCSSFYAFSPDRAPSNIATVNGAIQAWGVSLKKRVQSGKKILILMGVDLAHIGPRFGDGLELTPEVRRQLETEDKQSLEPAIELKADDFYLSMISKNHWRKVCGLSALYTGLRLLQIINGENKIKGQLLTYGQADDPLGGVVSFASALFTAPPSLSSN